MDKKVTLRTWIKDILILLVLLVFIVPVPVRFSVPAVEIRLGDEVYLEQRTISVRGWYKVNIFSDCWFSGRVTISGYPETLNEMSNIYFAPKAGNGSTLEYKLEDGSRLFFGHFQARFGFRRIVVLIFEINGFSTRDGRCLVARAKSYEDALRILQTYDIVPSERGK